ncbi:Holliday junction ATP-dependent DNA helicase RuvA [Philodulcilactobacillus myokoensis]|uniref:Holliday junction branch migration complex subunit RuvA n=1 Tax=Philodulcilactobacillus myokoensis TaxID=2929573 RepID=A0A9W6B0Q8_9LACO|nr:Holliday junction branch migration protein RuvA [Philodulcilactobacillus myokoensis]GLB46677.1 Holliday junction ATP-dependent DNA helicase RuvA [Philodulcilactobacillus myokoensis]
MFEYLKGYIVKIKSTYVVLDVNGVGYLIYVADPYYYQNDDKLTKIYVHQVVTDSFQLLYGFKNESEKAIFEKLIDVSGIGPKSALAILTGNRNNDLLNAIKTENVSYLKKFPGVGNKTAKQIILDLQGKINDLMPNQNLGSDFNQSNEIHEDNQALADAIAALKSLGYNQHNINQIQTKLEKVPGLNTNQYLSRGLNLLNPNRF